MTGPWRSFVTNDEEQIGYFKENIPVRYWESQCSSPNLKMMIKEYLL